MFSCRFCNLIFCLIDLNWKQPTKKKGGMLFLCHSRVWEWPSFSILSQKRKSQLHSLFYLTPAEDGLGNLTGLCAWSPLSGCSVLLFGAQVRSSRKWGWPLWGGRLKSLSRAMKKQSTGQGSLGSYLHPKCQHLHSFLLFAWQAPLPILLSLRQSAQVMEPGWRSSPQWVLFPEAGERLKEERLYVGQASQKPTRTLQRIHTSVLAFSFHFFTEWVS